MAAGVVLHARQVALSAGQTTSVVDGSFARASVVFPATRGG